MNRRALFRQHFFQYINKAEFTIALSSVFGTIASTILFGYSSYLSDRNDRIRRINKTPLNHIYVDYISYEDYVKMIDKRNKFKSGKESEEYYKNLGKEIDELFEKGILKKEFVMPSTYMAVPMKEDIINLPKKVIETIIYTTTYKNIKTLTKTDKYIYNKKINAYYFAYKDYHDTVSIVKKNPIKYEIIRITYEVLTIILSFVSLFIYIKNIKKFDNISIISHLLIISYMLIIGGVAYTHISSFNSIRPLYLANIYIIQSIFIMINMYRLKVKKHNI